MLLHVHTQIMQQVLLGRVSPRALKAMLAANLSQDDLPNQIGHDELHFDNNAIPQGYAYIESQRSLIAPALLQGKTESAWAAFGRLSHTAQDFYAHTNYAAMWAASQPAGAASAQIDPLDPYLLENPALHSGKLYYPQELLYFIPPLRKFALSFLPADSHARMNLDSPRQGPLFEVAFAAAVHRTRLEFERVRSTLPPDLFAQFCDLES
jgi:hypothetical protein